MNHVEISSPRIAPLDGISSRWLVPVEGGDPGAAGRETGAKEEPDRSGGPDRKVVLVVDDEQGLLEVMRFTLEGEGFAVETARNGAEALEQLRTGVRPALVLLDLMMPVMSGWEFLDEVARFPLQQPLPIVVLTAGGMQGVPGAVEVLRKPYDLGILLEAVDRHTRGRE
jgi:CheY-like chemotaxis protein